MSRRSVSTTTPSFSRHIHCLLCQRPKDESLGPSELTPTTFWLTSCACIICESCLFPQGVPSDAERSTYSCPACDSSNSKMIVMGEPLPPPVSPYFRSVTQNLEELINVHRFQMSHMSHFIDYLRSQVDKQRKVLNRVRKELVTAQELKHSNEALRRENEELWMQLQEYQHAATTAAPSVAQNKSYGSARSESSSTFRFEPPGGRRSASPPPYGNQQHAEASRNRDLPRQPTSLSREPATRPPTASRSERIPTATSERLHEITYTPTNRSNPNGISSVPRREDRNVMGPPTFSRHDAAKQTPHRRSAQAEPAMPPPSHHATPRAASRSAAAYVPSTPHRSHRTAATDKTPTNRQAFPVLAASASASRFSTPRQGAAVRRPGTPLSSSMLPPTSTPTHRMPFTPHRQ